MEITMIENNGLTPKARINQWLNDPLIQGALRSTSGNYFREQGLTPAESMGIQAVDLTDAQTRRAVWVALEKSKDTVDGSLLAGRAIEKGSLESMTEACSIFKMNPNAPQWLAVAALLSNTGMVKALLAAGSEPVDENGRPAITCATYAGVVGSGGVHQNRKWDTKRYDPTLRLLIKKQVLTRMSTEAKVEALDALSSTIKRAISGSYHSDADLSLLSHRVTAVAIVKLWASMPIEEALKAREASRVVFGVALGVLNKEWEMRRDPTDALTLPRTVARKLLESLAARQDWSQAEAICQSRGWTLGNTSLNMSVLEKQGTRGLSTDTQSAITSCFEGFERLTGQSIIEAQGILDHCLLSKKSGSGPALMAWMRKGMAQEKFLDPKEVSKVLRSFATMARSKNEQKKGKEALPDFEPEISALFHILDPVAAEAEQNMLNQLANEWGMTVANMQDIKKEDESRMLEAWGDKLDIAAAVLETTSSMLTMGPIKKRIRL